MEIWINPACSKCRSAISLLDAEGADYTVRRYLEDVPSADEIREVLTRLGLEPWEITRTQEAAAKELGLKDWPRDEASRERWITALAEHPQADPAPHHHGGRRNGRGGPHRRGGPRRPVPVVRGPTV
ncbi:hypothetical protein SVIOM342S_08150 [Streptomyces violaceorubidus]